MSSLFLCPSSSPCQCLTTKLTLTCQPSGTLSQLSIDTTICLLILPSVLSSCVHFIQYIWCCQVIRQVMCTVVYYSGCYKDVMLQLMQSHHCDAFWTPILMMQIMACMLCNTYGHAINGGLYDRGWPLHACMDMVASHFNVNNKEQLLPGMAW